MRLACIAGLLLIVGQAGAVAAPSDYDLELQRIATALADTPRKDGDVAASGRRAYLLYRRASLTARFTDFRAAETAIDEAIGRAGALADLVFLRATLDFKLHRLARTKDALDRVPELADTARGRALRADLALEEGRYDEARTGYRDVVGAERTWDHLARLAYLEAKTGDPAAADRLYREAEDGLTAKEMGSYAWVELQRGLLELDTGRYEAALAHYQRAARAYSGYWLVDEHVAECLDRLGRTDDAIALYRDAIRRTENPELVSALATILDRTDPAGAEALYREADALYEEQARLYPEAALGHRITHLIARREPGAKLLKLAEANHLFRPNAESTLLLAKVHLRRNEPREASALIARVLATPWRTPELERLAHELGVRTPR